MAIRNVLPGLVDRMEKAQSEIRAVQAEAAGAGISIDLITALIELKGLPTSDPLWITRAQRVLGLALGSTEKGGDSSPTSDVKIVVEKSPTPDFSSIRLAHVRGVILEELRKGRAGRHTIGMALSHCGLAIAADDLLDVLDDLCARDLVRSRAGAPEQVYGITSRGSEVVDGLRKFDDIARPRP